MVVLIVLLAALLAGCVTGPRMIAGDDDEEEVTESHCQPTTDIDAQLVTNRETRQGYSIETASFQPSQENGPELPLSRRAQQAAAVIGIQPLLREMYLLQDDVTRGAEDASLRLLQSRQELSDQVLLGLSEASRVAAELECEQARAEDIAGRLDEIRNDIQQRRTVLAILADSISGVFAGTLLLLGSEALSGVVDLSGSVGALTFGVAALGGNQTYELKYSRNLLAAVWRADESAQQFPAAIWRYLNGRVREDRNRTRREAIMAAWRARLGKPGSKIERRRVNLFFGEGGAYHIAELRYRSEMLGLLKAYIRLMTQDLNVLFRETLQRRPPIEVHSMTSEVIPKTAASQR